VRRAAAAIHADQIRERVNKDRIGAYAPVDFV
jgi:hypothetical protein